MPKEKIRRFTMRLPESLAQKVDKAIELDPRTIQSWLQKAAMEKLANDAKARQ